jgi:GNAT superfamily N-acetyltransferase
VVLLGYLSVPSIANVGPGDVVSLRVRSPAGPRDVVGVLVAAGPTSLSVRRRDGSVEQVAVDDVEAGRVVPPGPARRTPAAELQQVMALGWRAPETSDLGGWLLRAGGGFTGRANSALVTPDPVGDLDGRLASVREWYGDRRLPARLQLATGAVPPHLTTALEERGWEPSAPTHVMTAEAAHVLRGAAAADVPVRLDPEPDDAWLALYRQDEHPLPAAARGILTNHPQVIFASIRDGDACRAVARVAVDGRWAGVFAVEVDPAHRRQGLAQAVVAEAVRWAVAQGARRSYLQVFSTNQAGIALWHRLGYQHHHDYTYRTAPT